MTRSAMLSEQGERAYTQVAKHLGEQGSGTAGAVAEVVDPTAKVQAIVGFDEHRV